MQKTEATNMGPGANPACSFLYFRRTDLRCDAAVTRKRGRALLPTLAGWRPPFAVGRLGPTPPFLGSLLGVWPPGTNASHLGGHERGGTWGVAKGQRRGPTLSVWRKEASPEAWPQGVTQLRHLDSGSQPHHPARSEPQPTSIQRLWLKKVGARWHFKETHPKSLCPGELGRHGGRDPVSAAPQFA